jgi:hypothetical protein
MMQPHMLIKLYYKCLYLHNIWVSLQIILQDYFNLPHIKFTLVFAIGKMKLSFSLISLVMILFFFLKTIIAEGWVLPTR